jgi:hypothetical protein
MQTNQAIFIIGSPGSGKDVVIRDICSNFNVVEFASTQIDEMLSNDIAFKRAKFEKQYSLLENRSILVTANSYDLNFVLTKSVLESVGYVTHLILVEADLSTSYDRLHNRKNLKESFDRIAMGNSNKTSIIGLFPSNIVINNSQVLDLSESREYVSSILDDLTFKTNLTLEDITKVKLKKKLVKGTVPGDSVDNRGLTPGTWSSYIGVSESSDVYSWDLSPIATGPMQQVKSSSSDMRSDQDKENTRKILNKTKAILFKKVAVPKSIE